MTFKLKCKWYQRIKCLFGSHVYIYRWYDCACCGHYYFSGFKKNKEDPMWTTFINGKQT